MDPFIKKTTSGVANALAFFGLGLGGWVASEVGSFGALQEPGVSQLDSALTTLWVTVALVPTHGSPGRAGVLSFS